MSDQKQTMQTNTQDTQKDGFFQRIKKTLFQKGEVIPENPIPAEAVAPPVEQPPPEQAPQGRGVMRISEQSLLYALWREWLQEQSVANLFKSLYLVLEKPEEEPVPMDLDSLEAEKQKIAVKLLIEAKKRYHLIHPDVEKRAFVTQEQKEEVSPVILNIDADAVVCISKGAMGAWIMLFPPHGEGKPFSYEDLMETLEAESICYGIDEEKIKQLADEPIYFSLTLIARGLPPCPGKDGWIEEKYPRELNNSFGTDEHGNVDYHSKINMQVVKAGDLLCRAIPPTKGINGMKVTGTVLPAEDGKPASLRGGINTELNDKDDELLATKDGNLLYRNHAFHVQPLFRVDGDVDYAIGNIDFPGDVQILGDVKSGFVVKAKGNLIVDGLVEGAILEAGGNISIRKGVLGDARAVIRSQQSVYAQYLENCVVYAGDTVETSSIIASFVYSDNAIVARSGRGTIIGGKLSAANLISANVIGCRSERLTELTIGEFPMLQQQKEELQTNMQEIQKEEKETEDLIAYLDTQDIPEDENKEQEQAQILAKLRLQKSVLGMKKERAVKDLEKLNQREIDISKCRVLCDTIYPTTQINHEKKLCKIEQKLFDCNIHLDTQKNEFSLY